MNLGGGPGSAEVLHLDMDCFYAAVEALDDPSLAGLPVIVGGTGNRGVVSSASYEARAFGVHSAMPTAEARRLCPQARFVSPRHGRYGEVSEQLLEIMRDVTPIVEPLSLDEAFLDVSGAHRVHGPTGEIAWGLRARVDRELHLRCSVGGGRSKLIAKLASKAAKPPIAGGGKTEGRGVLIVEGDDEIAFLHAHRVRAIPGVGPRTAEKLARLGINSVGELAELSLERLVGLFGKRHGAALAAMAVGVDPSPVEPNRALRSIGHEETFDRDIRDLAELERHARRQAGEVATRCRRSEKFGRTVQLKLKFADFNVITRSRTVDHRLTTGSEIAEIAIGLLRAVERSQGVRLLGVSVSNIETGTEVRQLAMFGEEGGPVDDTSRLAIETIADSIRERFGSRAITAASALGHQGRGASSETDR